MATEMNVEAERAAFEAAMDGKLDFLCQPGADYFYAETGIAWDAWQAARRATPSSECALPPLPAGSVYCALDMKGQPLFDKGWMFAPIPQLQAQAPLYTAEQVEQIRREAVEADRRARVSSPEIPDGSARKEYPQAAQGVKTWRERKAEQRFAYPDLDHMLAEIAELRAKLRRYE